MDNIQVLHFEDDGCIPNNADLPLMLYRAALVGNHNLTKACRQMFKHHNWGSIWINGVFDYHHYHSTAHETLGVIGGQAKVQFGGKQGEVIHIQAGDIVVIPAGVGHCRISASSDFRVMGAYPDGQNWDLCTGKPGERPQVLHNIKAVPLPSQDPVQGADGYLLHAWTDLA